MIRITIKNEEKRIKRFNLSIKKLHKLSLDVRQINDNDLKNHYLEIKKDIEKKVEKIIEPFVPVPTNILVLLISKNRMDYYRRLAYYWGDEKGIYKIASGD